MELRLKVFVLTEMINGTVMKAEANTSGDALYKQMEMEYNARLEEYKGKVNVESSFIIYDNAQLSTETMFCTWNIFEQDVPLSGFHITPVTEGRKPEEDPQKSQREDIENHLYTTIREMEGDMENGKEIDIEGVLNDLKAIYLSLEELRSQ